MSDNQFDGLSDNDWEESWDFAWSEFDWERHLREQDKVMHTYLAHYEKLVERADRIDEVAHLMGWDQEDWTSDESEGESNEPTRAANESEPASATREGDADADSAQDFDPYTIHKHPVYVSTRSLFFWLNRGWEFVAPACGARLPVRTALAFGSALARAEHNGLLATHSLDMGDFSLAVCQLKRALTDLNSGLHQLQLCEESLHPAFAQFRRQAFIRIFDIREIWLRVMRDCREELDRRVSEGEN